MAHRQETKNGATKHHSIEETSQHEDTHEQTKEENAKSRNWVETINGNYGETLTCGDRVYYIDPQEKGAKRWRKGIILQRKADYVYKSGIRRSHGYDIYDIENCTTVSRTRHDIRKYKHTKIERTILERANKHLAEMREEFLKNDGFQNSRFESPVEFEISDYDDAVKNSPYPQTLEKETVVTPEPLLATQPETTQQNPQVKQEPME